MAGKPKPRAVAAVALPAPAVAVPVPHDNWLRSALTDHNGDFDTGRILVAVVILAMCFVQWVDVQYNNATFKPNDFGVGVGSVLVGFAAYLYGDAKRPDPSKTTTMQIAKTETSA